MAPILDAGGALFMPFIKAPEPYQPEKEEEDERGTHDHASDPTKKKPAMLRKEFETRCKQLYIPTYPGMIIGAALCSSTLTMPFSNQPRSSVPRDAPPSNGVCRHLPPL
eukprot:1648046-Rhodomonas_salina.5